MRKALLHTLNAIRRWTTAYAALAEAPYRSAIRRRYGRQRDAFMVATFADALGVPGPGELYTLELLPYMVEDFHDWHRRIGMERPPEGGWRCC